MDAVDKMNIKLKKIIEFVKYLKKYQGITKEILEKDFEKRAVVERYFQLAIDAVIDISNLLNAEYRFKHAQDSTKSIKILGEEGVLPEKFAKYVAKYLI